MRKENNIKKYLFISVKPEFANKIVSKEKCIELRKVKPNVKPGDYIIIYSSSPVKSVIGFGEIKSIIEATPQYMWEMHSHLLGIDKCRYDLYYKHVKKAIGIEIGSIKALPAIHLNQIKQFDNKFHPPQVYRYVTNKQICEIISHAIKKRII